MVKRVVVALGGNAILKPGQRGTIGEQRENVARAGAQIASMLRSGLDVVITHGNGPQIGNILRQNEETRRLVPPMPLDVCGAQSQGMIGYLLQQALSNALAAWEIPRRVVTILTQVVVDRDDPAFSNPTKPIGTFYTEAEARALSREKGFMMREDAGRGWRRVVASPTPLEIVESGPDPPSRAGGSRGHRGGRRRCTRLSDAGRLRRSRGGDRQGPGRGVPCGGGQSTGVIDPDRCIKDLPRLPPARST